MAHCYTTVSKKMLAELIARRVPSQWLRHLQSPASEEGRQTFAFASKGKWPNSSQKKTVHHADLTHNYFIFSSGRSCQSPRYLLRCHIHTALSKALYTKLTHTRILLWTYHIPAWIPKRPDACLCQKDFFALHAQTVTAGSACGCSSKSTVWKNKVKMRTWKPTSYLQPILQGSSQARQWC